MIVWLTLRNPRVITRQVRDDLRNTPENDVSINTIRRRIYESGLRSRSRARVPALTMNHRRQRLIYAQTHVNWTERQWSCVLFTDESRFCLYGNDRRHRIWHRRNTQYHQQNVARIRAFHGGSVMVWAVI